MAKSFKADFSGPGTVPVVLFIYRRPGLVRDLLRILQEERPQRLWIVADGPKASQGSDEVTACHQARLEAERGIIWPCDVRKVYGMENLGLRMRVETGLDTVFSEESSAILLEDDCHPLPGFFPFVRNMLGRYPEDPRIVAVSGSCFLPRKIKLEGDYFFTRYFHVWGWATWASRWKTYRRNGWTWPEEGYRKYFPGATRREARYWDKIFDRMLLGNFQSWAYAWQAHAWSRGLLAVCPGENLVRNAGFGPQGTHTRDENVNPGVERVASPAFPPLAPVAVACSAVLDHFVFKNHYLRMEGKRSLWKKVMDRWQRAMRGSHSL